MTILHDTRKLKTMTVAEADAIFLEIARLNAFIEKEQAALKKKIADLTFSFQCKIAAEIEEKYQLEEELTFYVLNHPERFVTPRKHPVGQVGSYGITTDKAFVQISDKEAFIQFALENGYEDLYRTEHTPDKVAAMRRIMAQEDIPGVELIPAGEVVKISFKKGYAEQLESGGK